MEYLQDIKKIISEYSNIPIFNIPDDIELSSSFLNLDTFDVMNIFMDIEENYNFNFNKDTKIPYDTKISELSDIVRNILE